jgi:hypothetical protein
MIFGERLYYILHSIFSKHLYYESGIGVLIRLQVRRPRNLGSISATDQCSVLFFFKRPYWLTVWSWGSVLVKALRY